MPAIFQKFFRLSSAERLLFIQAFMLSGLISFLVTFIPNRIIFKGLGLKGVESSFDPINEKSKEILKVEKAIRRAVRYLPWRIKCLAQAITAKRILQWKKIPSTIYLGVAKEGNDRMIAHAWLRCGNKIITGKEGLSKFTPLLFFT